MLLTSQQHRFREMIAEYPKLSVFWDFENSAPVYRENVVAKNEGLTSGEQHLLKFFAGVWNHTNDHEFDFIEAVRSLSRKELKTIVLWLDDPYWP